MIDIRILATGASLRDKNYAKYYLRFNINIIITITVIITVIRPIIIRPIFIIIIITNTIITTTTTTTIFIIRKNTHMPLADAASMKQPWVCLKRWQMIEQSLTGSMGEAQVVRHGYNQCQHVCSIGRR